MTWYLDGVNLSTLAWNIKQRSAGWSTPSKESGNVRVPGRHGAFWVKGKTFDEGNLSLSMWAIGCNHDGSMPNSEDGQLKVRNHLDTLTGMFANNQRLLNLRHIQHTSMGMLNMTTNPRMVSSGSSGQVLATNYIQDVERSDTQNSVISTNLVTNPLLKGRTDQKKVVTEELYPDPLLNLGSTTAATSKLRGYFYPIVQDVATKNRFFTPINGFNNYTGPHGLGYIDQSKTITFPGDAWIGEFGRQVWADRTQGVFFLAEMKIASTATPNTISMSVTPSISYDGEAYTAGSVVGPFTLTKNYSWVAIPASALPSMAAGPSTFWVKYGLRILGGSSWAAGNAIHIRRLTIQDAPVAGNPWRTSTSASLMFIGGDTPGTINRAGNSSLGWSDVVKNSATGWEPVLTGSTSTTSPYAFTHAKTASAGKGEVQFIVYGGTSNTFRRVLPTATETITGTKAWGTLTTASGTTTVRVTERTGSAGSYTYTTVSSTTVGSGSFTTPTFTSTAGKTYCLEVVVPSGTGFNAASILKEAHVSNGLLNTSVPSRATSISQNGSTVIPTGTFGSTTLVGSTYTPYGATTGIPATDASLYTQQGVNWNSEAGGLLGEGGTVALPKCSLPISTTPSTVSVHIKAKLVASTGTVPSGSATGKLYVYNASGALSQTLPFTLTGLSAQESSHTYTATVSETMSAVSADVVYDNTSAPQTNILVTQFHLMHNKPAQVESFTGSSVVMSSGSWSQAPVWTGTPFFSTSQLISPLPKSWGVQGFVGFEGDGRTLQFTGSDISVKAAVPVGSVLIGYQRGTHTVDYAVSVKFNGIGTSYPLGNITSGTSYVQSVVTAPAGVTSLTFTTTAVGSVKTLKDLTAIMSTSSAYPLPSPSGWSGFLPQAIPSLSLSTNPDDTYPSIAASRNLDQTLSLVTGNVLGWTGPLLGGGFLPVPATGSTQEVISDPIDVSSSNFLSIAAQVRLNSISSSGKIQIVIQAASTTNAANNVWTTLSTTSVTSIDRTVRVPDISMIGMDVARLKVVTLNTGPSIPVSGTIGIIRGITMAPSIVALGATFPGVFMGALDMDGVSPYRGTIRQTWVEVVESIDMSSSAYGTMAEFNVNLVVPGAFWEDVYSTTTTETASPGTTSGYLMFDQFGGATASTDDALVEISPLSGTITSLRISDRGSGNFLVYDGPAQTRIVIDSKLSQVMDAKGNSILRYVPTTGGGSILPITPYFHSISDVLPDHASGVPIMDWECNVPIKVTVTGNRKYLIA